MVSEKPKSVLKKTSMSDDTDTGHSFSSSAGQVQDVHPFSAFFQISASRSTKSKGKCGSATWTTTGQGSTASRSPLTPRVCNCLRPSPRRAVANQILDDIHFPTLTVNQTIKFALRNKVPREREQHPDEPQQYVQHKKNSILDSLGIGHTTKTKIGNEFIRGVSGGERKRVSLAEMMAGHVSPCDTVQYR